MTNNGAAYSKEFYDRLDDTAEVSARRILPLLAELTGGWPRSVVDFGCGDGGWLRAFLDGGAETVLGFDGPWVRPEQLKIPLDRFEQTSLDRPRPTPRRFDLAMSLEVAEHLPPARAAGFVADLCAASDTVLFSAAPPGQGGLHHVNEQWPAYWQDLFAAHGMVAVDALRWKIWNDPVVAWWYKQNLLLFVSAERLAASPALRAAAEATVSPLPGAIHPDLLAAKAKILEPGFGRWLKMGKAALLRSLTKRRARARAGRS